MYYTKETFFKSSSQFFHQNVVPSSVLISLNHHFISFQIIYMHKLLQVVNPTGKQ